MDTNYYYDDRTNEIDDDFISRMNLTVPLPDLEKVSKQIKAISGDINNLENKIQAILTFQYNEYVTAFENFMDSIRAKLREKIEEMEQKERDYQKKNDIQVIKTERDFFRKEAVRLNGLCKEMSQKIEDMGFNMKLMNGDISTLTSKWKESENINKQLLVELENNINMMKTVEKENNELKERTNKIMNYSSSANNRYDSENNDFKQYNNDDIQLHQSYKMIEKLKIDLKKEKNRNHKTLNELNKMILDKNQLAKIFNDCVEEIRKDIFNRKLKETVENNTFNKKNLGQSLPDIINIPYVSDIKYDKFLASDKKRLIENFVLKDEVASLIHELMFSQSQSELEKNPMFQGINILNENRISVVNEPLTMSKGNFPKGRFTFSSSVGKKTHGNFGGGMKFNSMRPLNY